MSVPDAELTVEDYVDEDEEEVEEILPLLFLSVSVKLSRTTITKQSQSFLLLTRKILEIRRKKRIVLLFLVRVGRLGCRS